MPGNTNASTGRQALRARDANAFCVLSTLFRADDAWNPEERRRPWDRWPNVAMDREEVKVLCEPVARWRREKVGKWRRWRWRRFFCVRFWILWGDSGQKRQVL